MIALPVATYAFGLGLRLRIAAMRMLLCSLGLQRFLKSTDFYRTFAVFHPLRSRKALHWYANYTFKQGTVLVPNVWKFYLRLGEMQGGSLHNWPAYQIIIVTFSLAIFSCAYGDSILGHLRVRLLCEGDAPRMSERSLGVASVWPVSSSPARMPYL